MLLEILITIQQQIRTTYNVLGWNLLVNCQFPIWDLKHYYLPCNATTIRITSVEAYQKKILDLSMIEAIYPLIILNCNLWNLAIILISVCNCKTANVYDVPDYSIRASPCFCGILFYKFCTYHANIIWFVCSMLVCQKVSWQNCCSLTNIAGPTVNHLEILWKPP